MAQKDKKKDDPSAWENDIKYDDAAPANDGPDWETGITYDGDAPAAPETPKRNLLLSEPPSAPEEDPLPPTPQPLKKTYEGSLLPFSVYEDGSKHFDSDAGIFGAVKRSFMLPGEVMKGDVDPLSDEGLGRSLEFTGTFGFPQTNFPRLTGELADRAAAQGGHIAKAGRKYVIGETDDPTLVAQRTKDMRDVGIEPTAGMVSGSKRAALKENALRPTSSGREIDRRINDAFGTADQLTSDMADTIASQTNPTARPLTKAETGQALVDQAERVRLAGKNKATELYDDVGRATGDAPAVGDASRKALADLHVKREGLSNSAKLTEGGQLKKAIAHAEAVVKDIDGGATFSTLKESRTSLNAMLRDKNLDPVLKGHLQTVKNALTDDMAATARSAGPEAETTWKTADDFYKDFKDPETGFGKGSDVSTLLTKDGDTANGFISGRTKEGAQRLNNIKQQVVKENGQEHWDRYAATQFQQMATDASGNMSGTTLAKNYAKLAPEAKDAYYGPLGSELREGIERLVRVSETLKEYGKSGNHSNTTTHSTLLQEMNPVDGKSLLAAALGGFKGVGAAVAGKAGNALSRRYQAKLLTDPKVVNLLADLPRTKILRGGLPAHLTKFHQIAATTNDAELRSAINEFLNAAGYNSDDD